MLHLAYKEVCCLNLVEVKCLYSMHQKGSKSPQLPTEQNLKLSQFVMEFCTCMTNACQFEAYLLWQ